MKNWASNVGTVEEVKKRQCCQSLSKQCLADKCMGWRWAADIIGSEAPHRGYCGLATMVDVENASE